MSWNDAAIKSSSYWNTSEGWWKFWSSCCTCDNTAKTNEASSQKAVVFNREKSITHYWCKEDDRKLVKLAEKFHNDWKKISERFTDKNASQLERRWKNKLDPNIKRGPWTEEEDIALKTLVLEFGNEWENIYKYMKGRSPASVEKRIRNVIAPNLSLRERDALQKLIDRKKVENEHMMDLDESSVNEESIERLNKAILDLRNAMQEKSQQINKLESEICDSNGLFQ